MSAADNPIRIDEKKWEEHITCEGARFHVLSYYGIIDDDGKMRAERRCSEQNCIINKPREK